MKRVQKNAVLIYDGECNLCRAGKQWIEKRALPGRIEFLPCQSPERERRFPDIKREQCMTAMQFSREDGRLFQGAEAIPEILSCLRGWRWLARLLRFGPLRRLGPGVYGWVARHRQLLSCAIPHRNGLK